MCFENIRNLKILRQQIATRNNASARIAMQILEATHLRCHRISEHVRAYTLPRRGRACTCNDTEDPAARSSVSCSATYLSICHPSFSYTLATTMRVFSNCNRQDGCDNRPSGATRSLLAVLQWIIDVRPVVSDYTKSIVFVKHQ